MSTNNLLSMIGTQRTAKIDKFASDSGAPGEWGDEREWSEIEAGANAVSSLRRREAWSAHDYHSVLLDLDVPAYLVPSSTEGHSHLYVDVKCKEEDYFALLDQLAKCGVIEDGYAKASKAKGATFLRLPWVKKEGVV